MGQGIWPVFEPGLGIHPKLDGSPLLAAADALDRLAVTLGVRTLISFADRRQVDADGEEDDEGIEQAIPTPEDWHDPGDGLSTFGALIAALQSPETAREFDLVEDLLFELRDIERCLRIAVGSGARFRLQVL